MSPESAQDFLNSIGYIVGISNTKGHPKRLEIKEALRILEEARRVTPPPAPKVRPRLSTSSKIRDNAEK